MGRTPITVRDAPGFLVNLGGRAYTSEGMRILHEGIATPAQVRLLRELVLSHLGITS